MADLFHLALSFISSFLILVCAVPLLNRWRLIQRERERMSQSAYKGAQVYICTSVIFVYACLNKRVPSIFPTFPFSMCVSMMLIVPDEYRNTEVTLMMPLCYKDTPCWACRRERKRLLSHVQLWNASWLPFLFFALKSCCLPFHDDFCIWR